MSLPRASVTQLTRLASPLTGPPSLRSPRKQKEEEEEEEGGMA